MAEKNENKPPMAEVDNGGSWDMEAAVKSPPACHMDQHQSATLSWKNLVVKAKDVKGGERQILKSVTGYIEPRHMLAIMGPSGCGKSTLLDTLSGRLAGSATWEGEIRVNGNKAKLSYGKAAYVTQDEVLIGSLSVRETLLYAARLRLPASMPRKEKSVIVDEVIGELGLEAAADTAVGNWFIRGISGGQRRRVSIGCELVTSPALMFLDEPTSGLDSAAAFHVMSVVRRLTEHCRTVIAVIHQPSSEVFELMDKLCLLSAGEVVYFGDADRASDFFSSVGLPVPVTRSAPDHFLHCINRDFASDDFDPDKNTRLLVDQYAVSNTASEVKKRVDEMSQNPKDKYVVPSEGPGWFEKTAVLTERTFLNNLRSIDVFWMRLAMYIVLCLGVGFVFFQLNSNWSDVYSRAALLFFVVSFLTFMAVAAFPSFVEDLKVYIRERLNGYYKPSNFTVANTLASLPFILLISIISSVIVYFLTDLRGGFVYWLYFVLDLFFSLVVVESLMMAIAPVVPSFLAGIAAGAGILGIFMIVCGFFRPLGDLPNPILRYPLSYISFHTFAFSGFMRNEFEGTSGWGCPQVNFNSTETDNAQCSITGEDVLQYWSILDIDKWVSLAILIGMALFYRAVFATTLKLKEVLSKRK